MQNDKVNLEPMTDGEIYQLAHEDWLGVLSRLWRAFGKQIDPDQMTIYRDMLGKLPTGLLELAIDRTVREHTYNTVPTVAEVWQAARKELGNPHDIDRAIEDWCESSWCRCVVKLEGVAVETEVMA